MHFHEYVNFCFLIKQTQTHIELNKKRQKQPGQSFILLKEMLIFLRDIKKQGSSLISMHKGIF